MDAASKFRKAVDDRAQRALNVPLGQPRASRLQSRLNDDEIEAILRLPVRVVEGLQDLDPSSPTLGSRAFVLGVSDWGDDVLGGF